MNFEFFIVKKSIRPVKGSHSGTRSLVTISVVAIALSLAVMILSVTILTGFKKEIKEKLTGFGGHIQVTRLDSNNSWESFPINPDEELKEEWKRIPGVNKVFPFITKPAIVQSGNQLQGIVLKGVDSTFSWDFFSQGLKEGRLPDLEASQVPEILVSESLSRLLKVNAGDKITLYFIQDPPRMPRPFIITGIYSTGIEEYDKLFVYGSMKEAWEVCGWEPGQITGFGISLEDSDKMESTADQVELISARYAAGSGELLKVQSLRELSPGFFDFLSLTDTNVWVILALMLLIAGFNMISGLLIIILDRTRMIGVLKALGASNRSVSRIFLYQGLYITGKGILFGTLIGLGIALVQDRFQLIPLNPENYFVNAVPILINPLHMVLLLMGTIAATLLMMLVPSGILSRISPDKTIKFD